MNKGDIIYFKKDSQTEKGYELNDSGYELTHEANSYIMIFDWVHGLCNVDKNYIDYSKTRNEKIDKLLDET